MDQKCIAKKKWNIQQTCDSSTLLQVRALHNCPPSVSWEKLFRKLILFTRNSLWSATNLCVLTLECIEFVQTNVTLYFREFKWYLSDTGTVLYKDKGRYWCIQLATWEVMSYVAETKELLRVCKKLMRSGYTGWCSESWKHVFVTSNSWLLRVRNLTMPCSDSMLHGFEGTHATKTDFREETFR